MENFGTRKVRGVILADTLPLIVRHTIELLNSQLRSIDNIRP